MKANSSTRKLGVVAIIAICLLNVSVASAHKNSSYSDYRKCRKTTLVDFPGTIVDAAIATPSLSTLTSLVVQANLVDALSGPGPLTVYAPTDDAFAKIPAAVLSAIGGDPAVLTAVLTYHVTPGYSDPRKSLWPKEVKTLQGQTIFLDYDKGPQVNQSSADCQGVRTTNGVVWIIDSVLLPQFK